MRERERLQKIDVRKYEDCTDGLPGMLAQARAASQLAGSSSLAPMMLIVFSASGLLMEALVTGSFDRGHSFEAH